MRALALAVPSSLPVRPSSVINQGKSHYRQSGKLVGKAKLSYLEMILNNQKCREKRKGLEYRPHLIALSYFLNNIINNDYISLMPFFFFAIL